MTVIALGGSKSLVTFLGTGERAQEVNHLLCKREHLSSEVQHLSESLSWWQVSVTTVSGM